MSTIHYFQRYSQRENVVTNNTLLLLSRLYNNSYIKFSNFISSLLDGEHLNFGLDFLQQLKGYGSVPDGVIKQDSMKIVLETKLYDSFSTSQLVKHLRTFDNENNQVLLSIGPKLLNKKQLAKIENRVKEFNSSTGNHVVHLNITFEGIIKAYREVLNDFDIEMHEIIDDYEGFCQDSHLLHLNKQVLLAVPCGSTHRLNIANHVYYDPAKRNYSHFTHLGIYTAKNVKVIGKLENVVFANYVKDQLEIVDSTNEVTKDQKVRIVSIIKGSKDKLGWDVSKDHKFFCVDRFIELNYRKNTPYGIQNKRYFNINTKLKTDEELTTQEIAERLGKQTW